MLGKLEELIGKICSDTSVAKADFQQGYGYGYSFSNYNTDFFTAWEMSGYYRFSWSERHPSEQFTMDTRNETLASYVLVTQVGALRRARLRQRPIVIPGEAPSSQQWTIADTRWPRVKRYTSVADPTMVVESVNSLCSPRSSHWTTTSSPSWTRTQIPSCLRISPRSSRTWSACATRA